MTKSQQAVRRLSVKEQKFFKVYANEYEGINAKVEVVRDIGGKLNVCILEEGTDLSGVLERYNLNSEGFPALATTVNSFYLKDLKDFLDNESKKVTVLAIRVTNPSYEKVYWTTDIGKSGFQQFLRNHYSGNESFVDFTDLRSKELVVLNPANFASVELSEAEYYREDPWLVDM